MKHFLLFYEGAPDYLERRPKFRDAHLAYAWAAVERGDIIVAGALADPVDGAVLMFHGEDKSVAKILPAPIRTSSMASSRAGTRVNGRPSSVSSPPHLCGEAIPQALLRPPSGLSPRR